MNLISLSLSVSAVWTSHSYVDVLGHDVFPSLLPAAAVLHPAGSAGPGSLGSIQTGHRGHRHR